MLGTPWRNARACAGRLRNGLLGNWKHDSRLKLPVPGQEKGIGPVGLSKTNFRLLIETRNGPCSQMGSSQINSGIRVFLCKALHRPQTPSPKHSLVLFPPVTVCGEHPFTSKDGIRTRRKAQRLPLLRHGLPPGRNADNGRGHDNPGRRNRPQHAREGNRLAVTKRRALDRHECVDWEALWMCG